MLEEVDDIVNTELVSELDFLFKDKGNIEVCSYYKVKNGVKRYYDFQYLDDYTRLNGSYDILEVQELLYYIKEDY